MVANDPIIWRVLSWKTLSGGMNWFSRKYLYDDLVAEDRIGEYFKELERRGIEDAKVSLKGRLSWTLENLHFIPRLGTKQLSDTKKIHKLEDFVLDSEREIGVERLDSSETESVSSVAHSSDEPKKSSVISAAKPAIQDIQSIEIDLNNRCSICRQPTGETDIIKTLDSEGRIMKIEHWLCRYPGSQEWGV